MFDARTALYRFIAQSLVYPENDYVSRLRDSIGKITLESLDDREISLAALIRELEALSSLPLDQVQGEYTRLFINAYPHVPCSPYESVYREGVLMGESTEEVNRSYQKWGLVVNGEEVDHAAVEFEFLAFLWSLETREALDEAEHFRKEHLARWMPRFSADLAKHSRLGFYRELAELIKPACMIEGMSLHSPEINPLLSA